MLLKSKKSASNLSPLTGPRTQALKLLFLMLLLPPLAACGTSRSTSIPYGIENLSVVSLADPGPTDPSYRIAALDNLTIQVLRVPDLSGPVSVDPAGQVNLPFIGAVSAQGLTAQELSRKLEAVYGAEYLRDPQVVVNVVQANGNRVTVDGEVRQPGMYPVTNKSTLLQTITLASGPGPNANPREVIIFREIEGQRMAAAFDLRQIRRGEMEDPLVKQGDVIVVSTSKSKQFGQDFLRFTPIIAGVFMPVVIWGILR